jgi:hypothetical protein
MKNDDSCLGQDRFDKLRRGDSERASHGELTLGFAARQADAIAKAGDSLAKLELLVDDLKNRLDRLEKAPT